MSGGYGYDDRAIYSRGGNGYTDNRLALHDVAEDSFRHTASGGVCHHSGSVTPGGDMHHSYGCCRESAWIHGIGQRETDSPMTKDYVRRNHRKVDLVNRGINSRSQWSEIHPKVRSDGSYPKDFLLPKTIEDFKNMDISVIDRLTQAYGLPENGNSSSSGKGRQEARDKKLWRLLEFLGADQLTPIRSGGDDAHQTKHDRYGNSW